MNRLDTAHYRSLEGSLFTLEPPERQWSITLRLDAVKDLGSRTTRAGATSCYALSFSQQTPGRGHAAQGIYRLRHDALGEQELFIVPIGPSEAGPMRYEVIFN